MAVDPIAISYQVAWHGVVGKRFHNLLGRPSGGRVFRDIEVQNTAAVMCEDNEDIQHSEPYGRNCKEVDRYHLADVISKKRHPGLRWRSRLLGHQPRYRPFRNLKSQLSQFSMDSRCSPCWIGGGHHVGCVSGSQNGFVVGQGVSVGITSANTV